jgi:hypothetical protein
MGSPTKSLEKKNIIFKKGDEIRRLDGIAELGPLELYLF